jgi:putative endonuclease
MVTLYVLKGKTDKRYVGITNDLSRRLKEHRSKNTKGGQLLGDFSVLLTEEFPDYKSARKREEFLKSGKGREWLDKLDSKPESV